MTSQEIAAWYAEQDAIYEQNKKDEHMALTEFEERIRQQERDRGELLQQLSRLEGQMSATTKVEQSHLYDLLSIVRNVVENR